MNSIQVLRFRFLQYSCIFRKEVRIFQWYQQAEVKKSKCCLTVPIHCDCFLTITEINQTLSHICRFIFLFLILGVSIKVLFIICISVDGVINMIVHNRNVHWIITLFIDKSNKLGNRQSLHLCFYWYNVWHLSH